MDSSPLLLVLATTLSLPSAPAVDSAAVHRASEVRRLEGTRSYLREHWARQMQVLAASRTCAAQAQGWGDLGRCARIAQQRARLEESAPLAAAPENGETAAPAPEATAPAAPPALAPAPSAPTPPGANAPAAAASSPTVPVLLAGQH